ncbi:hypothetical protein B9T26_10575 [Acinetobacter sp. ANC 4169]|uniref:hypothetical protein n=1 Tax=Acinetobacter sp. ANC 4169 TaxID=1977879 RepID=UPI000A351DC6|nr:hypothetical protein [Acinetobacter sp. ANC 4169]OTG72365.1 hypothetical protein B9T26_10575 [Acinetobacter sp. ANC 4169]
MKDLTIPSDIWNPLSEDDKASIKDVLVNSNTITQDTNIVGDSLLKLEDFLGDDSPLTLDNIHGDDSPLTLDNIQNFGIRIDWPKLPNIPDPIKEACKVLCDTTAAAGFAACATLSGGAAILVCQIAVEAARTECKNRC